MCSFNSVNAEGFKQICQAIFDVGYKYGLDKLGKPSIEELLPDHINLSHSIKKIANEYRLKMNDVLREDLKEVKLISLSIDYWKNSYTGNNCLTVNIRYTKMLLE
ncbi:unnamed protein product [Rotaria sp. Silwood1]|nr:unnamed protein product [Rotaria sp. Silwood1]